jgi:hypothetical protein
LKELSVFIDESGDFGAYESHSPLYLLTLVFHNQSSDITPNLLRLQDTMKQRRLPDYTVHAGPLIRRDNEYREMDMEERRKIFNTMFNAVLKNVEFKKAIPAKHKLFQAADMLCTLELLSEKARRKLLSKSELTCFSSERALHKSYLRAIHKKRFKEI